MAGQVRRFPAADVVEHGVDTAGNFASMGIDPDQLFEIELATLW